MADKKDTIKPVSDRALEMIMRDVLDGVMELSLESAFRDTSPEFEIIDISTVTRTMHSKKTKSQTTDADVINFPGLKQAVG